MTVQVDNPLLIGYDPTNVNNVVGTDSFTHTANDGVVTIGSTGVTTDVIFNNTIDSATATGANLTVVSTNTNFNGNMGDTNPLGTVTTTDGAGPDTTTLNAASMKAADRGSACFAWAGLSGRGFPSSSEKMRRARSRM